MRHFLGLLVVVLYATTVNGQDAALPKCALQEMAIDAALGDASAQYNLGVKFFSGTEVPRDYAKAANLWRKASEAGGVPASNNLGFLKYYGRPGVERDHAEGLRLWRFAAEQGFPESQVHLGEAYSDGKFLKNDFIEAYAWASAGKHHSSTKNEWIDDSTLGEELAKLAEKVLVVVRQKLKREELAEAEKKAAEYIIKFAPR